MAYLFKAISIDDSLTEVNRLQTLLADVEAVHYIGNAPSLALGYDLLLSQHPDLLFLDIDLPDGNGLEAIDHIHSIATWPLKIVIYTVYDDQVINALRRRAFDYLVKPLQPEELRGAIERLKNDYESRSSKLGLLETDLPHQQRTVVMVNTIMGYQPIKLTDIVYAEHVDNTKHWRIYLTDGTSQLLRRGTSSVNILAMSQNFIQVNNRQIVNLCYITMLKKEGCKLAAPYDDVEIPVTRSYISALQNRMLFI